jgi:transcriptional regulator with XRE-family HTH domain
MVEGVAGMAEHLGFVAGTGVEFSKARRLLQIPLRRLAADMGCPVTTLARWEQDPRPLDYGRIERWAAALELCDLTRQAAIRRASVARRFNRRQREEAEEA